VRSFLICALALVAFRPADAAPSPEVLREERYNYRIVGKLPRGWKRAADKLVYTYAIDGIPLAHVHFVRERISGTVDVKAELERRAPHYRFPGAPGSSADKITAVRWGDREAFRYEHELTITGVACQRIVRATIDNGIWYECIETLYGEPGPAVAAGLACFRTGFMLLTRRIADDALGSPAVRKINDAVYGYTIEKPEGYVFEQPNPGADPGCRLSLLLRGPTVGQQLSIRLFEYGVRTDYDPARWLDLFDDAFRRSHTKPKRAVAKAPAIKGSVRQNGVRLLGRRDDHDVATTVYLWQAESGRVYGLRIVSHADAETAHAASLKRLLDSLALTGQER